MAWQPHILATQYIVLEPLSN